jgi:hypothetical protein
LRKRVLILANEYDQCSYSVKACLDERGVDSMLIPESRFLDAKFKWIIGEEETSFITFEDIRLNLHEISGVLFRYTGRISTRGFHPSDEDYVVAEIRAALLGWLNVVPGVVINRPRSETSFGSMLHLQEFDRMLGLDVKLPETLITNNLMEAIQFHQECGRGSKYKPFLTTSFYELRGDQIRLIEPVFKELPIKLEEIVQGDSQTVFLIGNEFVVSGEEETNFLSEEGVKTTRIIAWLLDTDFLRFDIVRSGKNLVFEGIGTFPRYFDQDEETQAMITSKIADHLTGV